MARIIDQRLTTTEAPTLTPTQRQAAQRRIAAARRHNPLRRVHLACGCPAIRDPLARTGDWLWCETCADHRRVVDVVE